MSMCYVSTPNKQCFDIEIDPKQTAQVVLNKVLEILDIVEVDFFGLKYVGPKKEELWLNLRNRLCDQIIGSTQHIRLKLRVKFFVQPQFVQQEASKELFYLQAKDGLSSGQISLTDPECDETKLAKIISFVAQAEHQDQTHNSYQRQIYENILKEIQPNHQVTPELVERIHTEHSQLHGMPAASARYFFLQEISTSRGYGVEHHRAHTEQGAELCFGVGPEGIILHYCKSGEEKDIPYSQIRLATHNDKCINIQLINDRGEISSDELFKLVSRKAAIALYRCITEMHSFYRCDTVCPDVQSQYCRDFKGTFVSIFNENSELGKRYIFDIQRTSQEAYDMVRRKLYAKSCTPSTSPLHGPSNPLNAQNAGTDEEDDDELCGGDSRAAGLAGPALANANENQLLREVKHLKRRLEVVEDSLLCCICMYQKVCMVLVPCGHMTCDTCSDRIEECPQCRTAIERFQKVFHGFALDNASKQHCHDSTSTSKEGSSLQAQQTVSAAVEV